jgi:hypothetical protein
LHPEIWKNKEEIAKSQKLLIDCTKEPRKRIMATRGLGSTPEETGKFQTLYQNFIDLYPDSPDKLDAAGLPVDRIAEK